MRKKNFLFLLVLFIGLLLTSPLQAFKFGVFTDPHYYDNKLGTGKALDDYLARDRKMIKESEAILKETINKMIDEKPHFVLVPGDLTKDGEVHNHVRFAEYLNQLRLKGIKVYVVPGNHDVNNPHSYAYPGNVPVPIPSVTPADFAQIYHEFGYGDAISRDPNSLSYIAEPVKDVWLFAIDSAIYENNYVLKHPYTGGKIRPETWDWIQKNVRQAKANNKLMIAMLHHGVLEHYRGQSQFFPEYLIDDWQKMSKLLGESGISIVFTGHYHSQDATMQKWVDPTFLYKSYIYDIETGSLVTYPSPYRIVEVDKYGVMRVRSSTIRTIDYNLGSKSFPDYAKEFLLVGLKNIALATVTAPPSMGGFGLKPNDPTTLLIVDQIAQGFLAHYAGDEKPDAATLNTINSLIKNPDPTVQTLGQTIFSLWTDLPPSDNTFSFMISDGTLLTKKRICSNISNLPNSRRPDEDTFAIQGKRGDVVTVYIDPNSAGRFISGTLQVELNDQIKGYSQSVWESGQVPFNFTTKLGATGIYTIKLSEGLANAFVGDYCITIETIDDTTKTFQPTGDVE